jgi:hypothetical protein
MPPFWLAVAVHLHSPLSVEQVAFQPRAVKSPAMLAHATGTDETVRHDEESGKVIEPVVIVLSV